MTAAASLRSLMLKANADGHAKMIEFMRMREPWIVPPPVRELCFRIDRKWRFDFAWPTKHGGVALEIQGGNFVNGAHNRPLGQEHDYEKLAAAQLSGWIVFFASVRQLKSGWALEQVRQALEMRK
jgi:hypothetical protein